MGVVLLATVASYFGTRSSWVPADRSPGAKVAVFSIAPDDPAWDVEVPDGPHRDEFQSSCLICHSARLPLSQPPFGRSKWAEVVHKMVTAYGAPMMPEDERRVVDYLLTARPPAL
jgi:hypothetical protein